MTSLLYNNMSCPNFTADDFAKWNKTSSIFKIPARLIAKEAIKDVRVALIEAIGANRVACVQALPDKRFRVDFTAESFNIGYQINGLSFRGVNITPTPAYETLIKVIVDRAPVHVPDKYFFAALSPYGRVTNVQHLAVRKYPHIKTGTRMVTMSVLQPIPPVLQIANFSCAVKYRGQPKFCFGCKSFGHVLRQCPKQQAIRDRRFSLPARPVAVLPSQSAESSLATSQQMDVTSSGEVPLADASSPPSRSPLTESVPSSQAPVAPMEVSSEELVTSWAGLSIRISQFKGSVIFDGTFSCVRQVTVIKRRAVNAPRPKKPFRGGARAKASEKRRIDRSALLGRFRSSGDALAETSAGTVSVAPPRAAVSVVPTVTTANRFAALSDHLEEPNDLDILGQSVVDTALVVSPAAPLAAPAATL